MRRAFTLLEVLLAIGLIAALSGGVFSFMFQIGMQKAALTARAADGQAGDAVFERIESDLAGVVASDSSGSAGIVGTATSLKLLTRGVGIPLKDEDRAWSAGDLQGSEIAFAEGQVTLRRWDAHRNRGGGGGGSAEAVSRHVAAMRIRYYDGTEWVESFDSKSKDGLPVAVEVSLWFGTPVVSDRPPAAPRPEVEPKVPVVGAPTDAEESQVRAKKPEREEELPKPTGAPDRVRVMVVPDGPMTAWKESR